MAQAMSIFCNQGVLMKSMFFSAILTAFTLPTFALAEGPVRIGSIRVSNRMEINSADFRSTCGITKVKFQARNRPAKLRFAEINFMADGTRDERIPIHMNLRAGESTRWFDLQGSIRCIDGVNLAARSLGIFGFGSSVIDVWGFQERQQSEQPIRLGMARLSEGTQFEAVNIANVCGLNEVKIHVMGDDAKIDFLAVKIVGRPGFQRIDVRENFRAGGESNWKDLGGQSACVTSFYIVGRSSNSPQDARVILFGR